PAPAGTPASARRGMRAGPPNPATVPSLLPPRDVTSWRRSICGELVNRDPPCSASPGCDGLALPDGADGDALPASCRKLPPDARGNLSRNGAADNLRALLERFRAGRAARVSRASGPG